MANWSPKTPIHQRVHCTFYSSNAYRMSIQHNTHPMHKLMQPCPIDMFMRRGTLAMHVYRTILCIMPCHVCLASNPKHCTENQKKLHNKFSIRGNRYSHRSKMNCTGGDGLQVLGISWVFAMPCHIQRRL